MDGEDALHAVALEGLPHGDGRRHARAVNRDDDPLVRLHAALATLDDGDTHLDRHAHPEGNQVVLHLRRVHALHELSQALARTARVAAGVRRHNLQRAATRGGGDGDGRRGRRRHGGARAQGGSLARGHTGCLS